MTLEIPDKPYYRIGEVARLLGTHTHVLRYWESSFPQLKPVRAASGQRLFRAEDLETLLIIKSLLHEQGYTIAGARKRLAELCGEAQSERVRMVDELKNELNDILRLLE